MGTRGCVAVKQDGGWRGVYNQMDSYPTYLGKALWKELMTWMEKDDRDLSGFEESLLRCTGWRQFQNGGECKYCGKIGVGAPHTISGTIHGFDSDVTKTDSSILKNIEETGYPDPDVEFHNHDLDEDTSLEQKHVTDENPDPLYIEWVYVVYPNEKKIDILVPKSGGEDDLYEDILDDGPVYEGDGYWHYGHCRYKHVKLGEIDLNGEEPNWSLLENITRAEMVDKNGKAEDMAEGLIEDAPVCPICGEPAPSEAEEEHRDSVMHESCVKNKIEEINGDVDEIFVRE